MNCIKELITSGVLESDKKAIVFFKSIRSLGDSRNEVSFNQLKLKILKAQTFYQNNDLSFGDTILLFEKANPDLYAGIIGALGLGIKILIVEPWMSSSHLNAIAAKTKPKAIFCGSLGKIVLKKSKAFSSIKKKFEIKEINQVSSLLEEIIVVDLKESDEAILTFTSGTTGHPKGVRRKHQFLIDQRSVLKKHLDYKNYPKMDLTVFTNMVLLNLILGKGSLVVDPKWNKKTIIDLDKLTGEYEVDTTACGPKFLELLLENTKNIKPKLLHIGGALGDISLYEKAIKYFENSKMTLVYGSTEAEPVAVANLADSVRLSRDRGFFQCLYVGNFIDDISHKFVDNILWVSGKHVSPLYDGDEKANSENKRLDENGVLWHCMGDRIEENTDGLYYAGRDYQNDGDCFKEQAIYNELGHSRAYIKGKDSLVGEINDQASAGLLMRGFKKIFKRKIIRDPRHRSRIDRKNSFTRGVYMTDVFKFIKERVPVIANLILALGLLFSVNSFSERSADLSAMIFSVIVLLVFITELRFMDELKDYEKDKIAHPDRPLPRGLVTPVQVQSLVNITFLFLVVLTGLSFVFSMSAGIYLSITTAWLYLMYKEFFFKEGKLGEYPLLYAISHQVVIVPVCLFMIQLLAPETSGENTIAFCMLILSSFFTFEVGRKLDPSSHRILGTYLVHYGRLKTYLLISILSLIGLTGGVLLNLGLWTFIPYSIVYITMIRVYFFKARFKDLEGIIALSLILNLWALFLARIF